MKLTPLLFGCLAALGAGASPAAEMPWPDRPLTLAECLDIALQQNATLRASRQDLEAAHGLSVQTRAVVLPKVTASGDYALNEDRAVERLELPPNPLFPAGAPVIDPGNQRWTAGVRLVQTFFEGGRLAASWRAARLVRDQALARHRTVIAEVVTAVRVAYADVLLAEREIVVADAAVALLEKELEDNQRRFNAGTVPRFNVLRAEVELANAQPRLSRARNAHRLAKNHLVHLLGYTVPQEVWEDLPLRLAGSLEVPRFTLSVPEALARALAARPELVAARLAEQLHGEDVRSARAGYLPRLQGYVGYGARKSTFSSELDATVHGWEVGVQATWNVFDGALTRGKVTEARARLEKSRIEADDLARQIELEVRAAYSSLVEAWEVRESQQKVVEQAEEALRLARARADAGTGTQLDVLSAQTALTEARTTDVRARHDYVVALARLERAIGAGEPEVVTTVPARDR